MKFYIDTDYEAARREGLWVELERESHVSWYAQDKSLYLLHEAIKNLDGAEEARQHLKEAQLHTRRYREDIEATHDLLYGVVDELSFERPQLYRCPLTHEEDDLSDDEISVPEAINSNPHIRDSASPPDTTTTAPDQHTRMGESTISRPPTPAATQPTAAAVPPSPPGRRKTCVCVVPGKRHRLPISNLAKASRHRHSRTLRTTSL